MKRRVTKSNAWASSLARRVMPGLSPDLGVCGLRKNGLLLLLCTLVAIGFAPIDVFAQAIQVDQEDVSDEEQILMLWHVTLTPATAPTPALKYQLRMPTRMLTAGDATEHYYRALLMEALNSNELKKEYSSKWRVWLEKPEDSLDEIKKWLSNYEHVYNELRIAATRERHDVDLRLRDLKGLAAIQFRLPDTQRMRELARILQLRARIEIVEGRFDDAIETIRVGYRLADASAETPTLINDLVGIAIGSIMTQEVLRMAAHPDAPNMYWAVSTLPHPVVDMRDGLDWESGVPWQIFPFLRDPETADRSADAWRKLVMDTYMNMHHLTGDYSGKPGPMGQLAATAMMMKSYPIAKKALIAGGMDSTKVESMPVGQVIAIHTSRSLTYVYDETFKWMYLGSSDVHERMKATARQLIDEGHFGNSNKSTGALPIAGVLLPAMSQAWYASVRLEREIAALRVIEAIRMHCAEHGNTLPTSLEEITVVPVPNDPLFEKAFDYRVDGDRAVLTLLPRSNTKRRTDEIRYVLQIAD